MALAVALALPGAAAANELVGSALATGITLHDANETMRDYCHWNGATLVFELPGGESWELVTSISDPVITNPGDGQFHAYDAAEVRSALAGVRYPLSRVSAEVFMLPYPRRFGLESAAGPGLILLSPGVRPLPIEQQHSEFTHELGHVVQYTLMPDTDGEAWAAYRGMRGIVDPATYSATAPHSDRPHEIFAEDFRALFGDAQANAAGSIENASLSYPTSVTGLAGFIRGLAASPETVTPITVARFGRGGAIFSRGGTGVAVLDLFDVTGRHVTSIVPVVDANGCRWSWDGHTASGLRVGGAVLWARARDGAGGTVRLVHLP